MPRLELRSGQQRGSSPQEGPRFDDIVWDEARGKETEQVVPLEVLRDIRYTPEPSWGKMERMSFFDFYQGLRQRNWTSRHFKASAEPWQIEFFQDSGRFLRPNEWEGYRAVVTTRDGRQRWVELSEPGAPSFLQDYLGGGTLGGIYRSKRGSPPKDLSGYGYNQVFEEIFAAFEQRLSTGEARMFFDNSFWVDAKQVEYKAPGADKLSISWHWTAPEMQLGPYIQAAPKALFWGFTYSFIAIAIGISLFAKQKKPPMDIQGVRAGGQGALARSPRPLPSQPT